VILSLGSTLTRCSAYDVPSSPSFRGASSHVTGNSAAIQAISFNSEALARAAYMFYDRSHKHVLPGVGASNGLFEVPFAALEQAGCSKGSPIPFERGGL